MADIEKIERELRENLASFDAEVAYELENEGERADLWTDIDVPVDALRLILDELSRSRGAEKRYRKALERLVNAKALQGVRELVAGWNGENRPDGVRYERHPNGLGATLPKTSCGAVYELDEAMVAARAALGEKG